MDWDKLKGFYHACTSDSMTAAAKKLDITQSSLSRQIKTLENQIGEKLFKRSSKGLFLTEKGEILFESARKIFAEIERAKTNIKESSEAPQGHLKVNCVLGFSALYLIPRIHRFLKDYPHVYFQFKTTDYLPDFNTRDCDILIHPHLPENHKYSQQHLITYHLNLYASREYLEKNGTPKTPQDLDKHCLISYGSNTKHYENSNWVLSVGRSKGEPRVPYIENNSTQERFILAQQGIGITVLPGEHPGLETSNLVRVLEHLESPTVDLYFICSKDSEGLQKVKIFKDWLFKELTL